MANSVKSEKKKLIIQIVIVVLIALLCGIVTWILTSGKETYTVSTTEHDKSVSVVCEINTAQEDSFFDYKNFNKINQQVKTVFVNNELKKIFYSSATEYDSAETASSMSATLLARYNIYLGKFNIPHSKMNSSFDTVNSTLRIDIYTESDNINSYTGKIFYIDSDEFYNIKSSNPNTLKNIFIGKGFSCKTQE